MAIDILVLGGGGREHALCWRLRRSESCGKLWCAPGNPGITGVAECVAVEPTDPAAVVAFARAHGIGLVVVGPEAPLVAGVADALRAAGVPVFGPSAAAARLEGSKGFTKAVCDEAGIPTAAYRAFDGLEPALAYAAAHPLPVVVKADGLAAGKGVTVARSHAEAAAALRAIFADAGAACVIEECMTGEEVSFFVLCDGETALPFGSAQDHKRVSEGDAGPNTGGMGAYSPAAVFTPELERRAMREVIEPTLRAMAARGTPYAGVLFAGLMLTDAGPKLIEYNCRFGDPECQVLMARFDDDLAALLLAAAEGRLAGAAAMSDRAALTVVLAAEGYPGTPAKGDAIAGIEAAEAIGATVFHAGTAMRDGALVSAGGRVLAVTGTGGSVREAADAAYAAVEKISFRGVHNRRDIGHRAIARGE